jgi:excisionase family DNA binding protein
MKCSLMHYKDAAEYLGIAEITLKKWIAGGRIPIIKYSRKCAKIDRKDLDNFIASCRVSAV